MVEPSLYDCAVCHDLLLDPVVGRCGHDACKSCMERWAGLQSDKGRPFTCPQCRQLLAEADAPPLSICIRLKETIERLYPERIAQRRRDVEQQQLTEQAHDRQHAEPHHQAGNAATTNGIAPTLAAVEAVLRSSSQAARVVLNALQRRMQYHQLLLQQQQQIQLERQQIVQRQQQLQLGQQQAHGPADAPPPAPAASSRRDRRIASFRGTDTRDNAEVRDSSAAEDDVRSRMRYLRVRRTRQAESDTARAVAQQQQQQQQQGHWQQGQEQQDSVMEAVVAGQQRSPGSAPEAVWARPEACNFVMGWTGRSTNQRRGRRQSAGQGRQAASGRR